MLDMLWRHPGCTVSYYSRLHRWHCWSRFTWPSIWEHARADGQGIMLGKGSSYHWAEIDYQMKGKYWSQRCYVTNIVTPEVWG